MARGRQGGDEGGYDPDEVVRRYVDEGMSMRQVAKCAGINRSTVNRILRRRNIDTARTTAYYRGQDPAHDPDEIVRLYADERMTQAQVADGTGVSLGTVRRVLRDRDIDTRTVADYRSYDPDEVVRLYVDEGMSMRQVAERVGTSRSTVSKVLRDRSVKTARTRGDYDYSNHQSDYDPDEIVRLYVEEDLSQEQVAERVGISQPTVSNVLRDRDVDTGHVESSIANLNPDEVVPLYVGEGLSMRQVAERVGISRSTVSRVLRRRGVNTSRTNAYYQGGK